LGLTKNRLSREPSHSGWCGALLQLIVFDCPISSTFALPLSPHSRRRHIQQSCRTSHSLSLHLRSILFVPHSLQSYPGTFSSGNRVQVGTALSFRDCLFLRAPSAFNLPHYRSASSDSLASTPYVAYALILSYSPAIRMVGTSTLNRSDRPWMVSDAHTPPLPSQNILFPNLTMDLRDRHSEVAAKILAHPSLSTAHGSVPG
jgi:hypothetical protein